MKAAVQIGETRRYLSPRAAASIGLRQVVPLLFSHF
jgi:hypothetical protein